jgi:hypothetical protein
MSTFKLGFASRFSNQTASMAIIQLTYESDAFDYVHLDASMNGVNVTSSAKVTVDPGSLLIVWNPLNPTNGLLNATLHLQGKKEGEFNVNWRCILTGLPKPPSPPISQDKKGVTLIKIQAKTPVVEPLLLIPISTIIYIIIGASAVIISSFFIKKRLLELLRKDE